MRHAPNIDLVPALTASVRINEQRRKNMATTTPATTTQKPKRTRAKEPAVFKAAKEVAKLRTKLVQLEAELGESWELINGMANEILKAQS